MILENSPRLALFDLDNTLLGGDSDHAWGEFLIAQGLVNATEHRERNNAFYADYKAGDLDVHAYVSFTLEAVKHLTIEQLAELHAEFMEGFIRPIMLPAAEQLLRDHRQRGDTCLIITATNEFITRPIASELGVEHLLATQLERDGCQFTGRISGIPCFQAGKVERILQWMSREATDYSLDRASFYSDSINDLPLLEQVAQPVVVDGDEALCAIAQERRWRLMSLRST